MKRDLKGRAAGVCLFAMFLAFHVNYLIRGWSAFSGGAKANSLLITVTIILFLSSYFLRRRPESFAKGPMETLYPLFCASLPLVIYHDFELLRYIQHQGRYYSLLNSVFGIHEEWRLALNPLHMLLMFSGNLITMLGIISLRRSFSIMVEARAPVYAGLYAYVRHPLYLGEAVATAGVLIFRFSPANTFLFLVFIFCQVFRSTLEEKKLLSVFPSYAAYRQRTGAFFPRSLHCSAALPINRETSEK